MSNFMRSLRESAALLIRRRWFAPALIGFVALALLTARLLLSSSTEARERIQDAVSNHRIADPADFVAVYLPKALMIDLGLCAVLGLTWWMGRRELSARECGSIPSVEPGERRMLWAVVFLTMLVSGVLDAPRMKQSLWNDEVTSMRFFTVGGVRRVKKNNTLRVEPASWMQTVFGYWRPNNHMLYSIAARLSHQSWPKNRDQSAPYFSETALRLPAFLAGLASLAMIGGLALRLGHARVGMVAVVLLALHPWHVRFGTEARGYAFLLLFTPALLLCLVEGARTGLWRWWFGAGVIEFLLIYSNPLSIYVIATAVLSALLLILTQWNTAHDRAIILMRMVSGGLLGVMIAVPMMLPLFPQVGPFLEARVTVGQINREWLLRGLSELFTGVSWRKLDPANPFTRPWMQLAETHFWLVVLTGCGLILAFLSGVIFFWRRGTVTRCLLPALLLPAVLVTVVGLVKKLLVYHQYLVIGLPGLMLVMGAGIFALARWMVPQTLRSGRPLMLACGVGCFLFGAATHHQRQIMRAHPLEPRREAALVIHKTLNPRDPRMNDVVSAAFTGDRAYDPSFYKVDNASELKDIIEMAASEKRPLYLTCYMNDAENCENAEKSGQFERSETLYGTMEESTFKIYRLRDSVR